MVKLNLPLVLKYFDENWHHCKEQWVRCFKKEYGTYGISTTNHLESFNKRIKAACSKRQRQCIEMSTKIPSNIAFGTPKYKYFQYVTTFAYELIKMSKAEKVIFSSKHEHYAEVNMLQIYLLLKLLEVIVSVNFLKT